MLETKQDVCYLNLRGTGYDSRARVVRGRTERRGDDSGRLFDSKLPDWATGVELAADGMCDQGAGQAGAWQRYQAQ